jgi:DNA-binding protein HU-beta
MTKSDLIAQVAEQTSLTKKDSAAAIDAVFASITAALAQGNGLSITGFGSFAISDRAAKEGRNPKTGEKMAIAASKAVKFKPGKALKDSVN